MGRLRCEGAGAGLVYDYTLESQQTFLDAGVNITMVQVGNELSNGLLWPEGKVPNYDNIATFVNAGIRAVRKADAAIPVMIIWITAETMRCTASGSTILQSGGRISRLSDFPIIRSGTDHCRC